MTCSPSVLLLHKKDNSHYYRKRGDNGHNHTDYGSDVRLASGSDVRLASCKRR